MRDGPRAVEIGFTDDAMSVTLEDGRVLSVPLEWFPSLRDATAPARLNFRLVGRGVGVHWPDLDEDISIHGLLVGKPARLPVYEPATRRATPRRRASAVRR